MGLPICLFMMLGCNIGCTMSAILASFGCKKDAKRAACVHLLFNISGTIVCSIIFLLFGNQVVDFFMGISGNEAGRYDRKCKLDHQSMPGTPDAAVYPASGEGNVLYHPRK